MTQKQIKPGTTKPGQTSSPGKFNRRALLGGAAAFVASNFFGGCADSSSSVQSDSRVCSRGFTFIPNGKNQLSAGGSFEANGYVITVKSFRVFANDPSQVEVSFTVKDSSGKSVDISELFKRNYSGTVSVQTPDGSVVTITGVIGESTSSTTVMDSGTSKLYFQIDKIEVSCISADAGVNALDMSAPDMRSGSDTKPDSIGHDGKPDQPKVL